jgi:hypothetical protein
MTYRTWSAFYLSILLIAGALGCGSSEPARTAADDRREIEEAIDRHLAKRNDLDFSSMKVVVDRVNFVGDDQAEATVKFTVGEDAAASIQLAYTLQRTNEVWEVVGTPKGTQGAQTAPPAAGGAMPPDHPPVGGEQQQLPSGHPPVN